MDPNCQDEFGVTEKHVLPFDKALPFKVYCPKQRTGRMRMKKQTIRSIGANLGIAACKQDSIRSLISIYTL
jgi:hypothetical protein